MCIHNGRFGQRSVYLHPTPVDNGASFLAERTQDLLTARGVVVLSSRHTPHATTVLAKPGSAASGRALITWPPGPALVSFVATGRWSAEDVEAARRLADEVQFPRRLRGLTADEVWLQRTTAVLDARWIRLFRPFDTNFRTTVFICAQYLGRYRNEEGCRRRNSVAFALRYPLS